MERLLREAASKVAPALQAVVVDDFSESFARAVGDATADTWFDLASLTKPLCTTTLTMLLCERGQLLLDEEVRAGVRVHHLLSHSSGLPAWQPLYQQLNSSDRRREMIDLILQTPLECAPGEKSVYSDLGFLLLGDFLERKTSKRLDALFAKEIADPLGLEMRFGPIEAALCAPTENDLRGSVHDENAQAMAGVAGHAGLFAPAHAVSRLLRSLLASFADRKSDVSRLVSPETVRRFFTPCKVLHSTWCLGWDRPSPMGSQAGDRWPKTGVGHLGFTGCSLWLDPARGRAVALLSNRVCPSRANNEIKNFRPRFHDAVLAALDSHLT